MSQEEYLVRIVIKDVIYVAISYSKYSENYEKLKESILQFLKQLFCKTSIKQISHYEYILS